MEKEQMRQYIVAIFVAGAVLLACLLYGIEKSWSLSMLNRGLADTSMVLLGISLTLGMLSRLYVAFDKFLTYRKEIGIMAFFTGTAHVYLAMFQLARRGPFGFYESRPWSAYPGLLGLVLMFLLFVISFKVIEQKIGTGKWWKLQYWGARLAGTAAFVHIAVLRGPAGWELIKSGSGAVPSSFLMISFGVFVFLSRLTELFGRRIAATCVPILGAIIMGFNLWLMFR